MQAGKVSMGEDCVRKSMHIHFSLRTGGWRRPVMLGSEQL